MAENFIEKEYHLSSNPFLNDIGSPDLVQTWVNQTNQVKEWKRIIEVLDKPQKNYLSFIVGEYGMGKTQALYKILKMAGDLNKKKILGIFLDFRGDRSYSPGLDVIFELTKAILSNFEDRARGSHRSAIKKAINKIPNEFSEMKTILNKLYNGTAAQKI